MSAGNFIKAYLKHQKWHETQAARCHEALREKPKFAAKINEALKSHVACIPSSVALLQVIQISRTFAQIAKQHQLVSKLIHLVTPLFELDSDPISKLEKKTDLNKLIIQHGSQPLATI
jgi:DNA-binding phage protein